MKTMPPSDALETLVKALPKTDLHLHPDGSVDLRRMIEIARRERLKLPSYTVEGLHHTLFKDGYDSLEEYLSTFGLNRDSLKNILIYGFKRSFLPGPYSHKRAYVRQVIDYCDRVFEENAGVLP